MARRRDGKTLSILERRGGARQAAGGDEEPRQRASAQEWGIAWLIAALCAAGLVALTGVLPDRPELHWDNVRYLAMAQGHGPEDPLARWAPFCFRPLFPWLASLLSADARTGFRILALLGAVAGGAGLYGCARASGLDHPLSLLAIPLFLSSRFGFRYALFDVVPEGLSLSLLVWALYALLTDRTVMFGALVATSSLAREIPVLLLVPFVVFRWRRGDPPARILIPAVSTFATTLVAVAAAHYGKHPANGYHYLDRALGYGHMHLFLRTGQERIALAVAAAGGVPLALILIEARAATRFLRDQLHWIAYALVFLLPVAFGGNDMERYATHLLPAIILVTLAVIRDRPETFGHPVVIGMLVAVLILAERLLWPYPVARQTMLNEAADYMRRGVLIGALARQIVLFAACAVVIVVARRAELGVIRTGRGTQADGARP